MLESSTGGIESWSGFECELTRSGNVASPTAQFTDQQPAAPFDRHVPGTDKSFEPTDERVRDLGGPQVLRQRKSECDHDRQ